MPVNGRSRPTASARAAIARLHGMACLDATGPQLIEVVLQELHQLIDFDSGGYFHPDNHGELDAYMEAPQMRRAMPAYFDDRILRSERQVLRRSTRQFAEAARHEHGPQLLEQLVKVPMDELWRSDFYNVVLRPAGVMDCVRLILRTPQGRSIGALTLYRHEGSRRFLREDVQVLARLEACLAQVLQPGELDAGDCEVQDTALLVTTPMGQLLWASPEARQLMALAFGARWRQHTGLPPNVQALLQRLACIRQGDIAGGGIAQDPPQFDLRHAAGWFSLSATPLAAAAGAAQAVGVHLTRRIPRPVHLLATLRTLDLPQRQHEMAYWLARGLPETRIAERMGISSNTAVYHRRQLYARLGVHSRPELLARLSCERRAGRA